MEGEKFNAIVVGGGMAGTAAAYRMGKAGLKVLLIERGNYGGAKNMTGGRIYTHSLEALMPDFRDKAPLERKVVKERISILKDGKSATVEYLSQPENSKDESYTVLRSKFDRWFTGEAEKAGVTVVNRIQVTSLILKNRKVVGVRCGQDEAYADVVILAEGVLSLLAEGAGLRPEIQASQMAVGAKEVYTLPAKTLEDRFGVNQGEGVSWLFMGDITHGLMGGGFLYLNGQSISVGIVAGLAHIGESDATIEQMMVDFTTSPTVAPLLAGGKLVERSGHVVPEAGLNCVSNLSGEGYLIVGDAAGFCVNMGYTVRGMDFAIASGMYAGDTVIEAVRKHDFSNASLKAYDQAVKESFVWKDLELYRRFPAFMENERIFNEYPEMVMGIMRDVFTINGEGATPLLPKLFHRARKVGFVNLAKDAWEGVRSL